MPITYEQRVANGRKGGLTSYQRRVGVHGQTPEQRKANAAKANETIMRDHTYEQRSARARTGLVYTHRPHCGLYSVKAILARWHFDNRKHKPQPKPTFVLKLPITRPTK